MTGQAMALVRLQGCPVGCPFCDTKETWVADTSDQVGMITEALGTNQKWCEATAAEIASHVRVKHPQMSWVLLTGGEPALHDLAPLVMAFRSAGLRVALETSGTAAGHQSSRPDWVCVSPKFHMPGGLPVLDYVLADADELKFVVGKQADVSAVIACLRSLPPPMRERHVCLQPLSCNPKATELCRQTVKDMGWRLSVQTHKLLDER